MFRDRAAEGGVRLSMITSANRPWLLADSRLFSQAMINLISNAVKFTEIDGSVTISVDCRDGQDCRVVIRDTGIGISEENIPRVLEPFVQVEGAFSREHQGTGLGLPLVKKILELHGGSLKIDSRLGEGTTLTASFPAARVIALEAGTPSETLIGR